MVRYNSTDFIQGFKTLGIEKGDIVLVHSSLPSFGIPLDIPIRSLPAHIHSSLLSAIGLEGTIAVPTFNFDFCKGNAFNRQSTNSKGMGVFSEYIRNLKESKRSFHPTQSVSAVGKYKDYIVENDTQSPFHPEGPFGRLLELNTKVILLGSTINSVSMIHWVEEKESVPYRYWKSFSGVYEDQDQKEERTYKMYVRSLELSPQLRLDYIKKRLMENNRLGKFEVGSGEILSFDPLDFVTIAEECISKNPYFFVSNHPAFEQF